MSELAANQMASHFDAEIIQPSGKGKLFPYKEQTFTGFAPCFDDDLFSLACCKGNRRNGGLRRSACRWIEETSHPSWILSIAGSDIAKARHNASGIDYKRGDLIFLARISSVEMITNWAEYSERFAYERRDAIYQFNKDKSEMERIPDFGSEHPASIAKFRKTDLGQGMHDYPFVNQILLSREYVVFEAGCTLEHAWEKIGSKRTLRYDDPAIAEEYDNIQRMMLLNAHSVGRSPFNP